MISTSERVFCFVVVVWGTVFRNFFLEYCLPSLLAPGNIPALAGRRPAKYLIATTAEDWEAMQSTPIFRELQRYVQPTFIPLPANEPGRPHWMQAILGHKLCCDAIFCERAYRIFTAPDAIYSDGMVSRLHQLALDGASCVLKLVSPAVAEETFFETLERTGLLPTRSARDTGTPLIYSGRQLASVSLNAMHSMTVVNEWNAPYFCGYAATPWWRVPNQDGMIVFGLLWDTLLIDYGALKTHDSSLLDKKGFDGDYLMQTIGDLHSCYAIRDSDEVHVASWAALTYNRCTLDKQRFGELGKGIAFRMSYDGPRYNRWQRSLLFIPTRVHAGPIDEKWDAVESRALRTLLTWVDRQDRTTSLGRDLPAALEDFTAIDSKIASLRLPWWRRNAVLSGAFRQVLVPLLLSMHSASFLGPTIRRVKAVPRLARVSTRRVGLALRGNSAALRWWRWRIRKVGAGLLRRPFNEPRPETPDW